MAEIIDFSDLAEDVKFRIKEEVFVIPPISNRKAQELFSMSKKISDKKNVKKQVLEGKEVDVEEVDEDTNDFIDFQAEFISASIVREDGSKVSKEDIFGWPTKVTNAVNKLITETISGVAENTEKEKK